MNNRLAEIYFEKKKDGPVFIGHCYVEKSEYKTKYENTWIEEDVSRYKFIYRKGEYKLKI